MGSRLFQRGLWPFFFFFFSFKIIFKFRFINIAVPFVGHPGTTYRSGLQGFGCPRGGSARTADPCGAERVVHTFRDFFPFPPPSDRVERKVSVCPSPQGGFLTWPHLTEPWGVLALRL